MATEIREAHFMEKYFSYSHLNDAEMKRTSQKFSILAHSLMYDIPMDERLRIKALWKLWEAKNLAVLALSPNG